MTSIGLIFPPDQPPQRLRDVASAAEEGEIEELWLWEDCFAESGMGPAAAVLAWTQRLQVGVGLFPVPLRNVALTAMEIATLARMFPDRFLPGIGHGVLGWMEQVGERVASPLTLLREYATALRSLLDGKSVTTVGRYVTLDAVQLQWPPSSIPLWIGAEGPKTLALAGELGDGIILTGGTRPEQAREAIQIARDARTAAGVAGELDVVSFLTVPVTSTESELNASIAEVQEAGVNRIAVCGMSDQGRPEGGERILEFAHTLAQVRR